MGLILVVAGALFALFFILIAIIRTLRHSTKITFVELLLAFLAALLPLAGVVEGSMGDTRDADRRSLRRALRVGGSCLD